MGFEAKLVLGCAVTLLGVAAFLLDRNRRAGEKRDEARLHAAREAGLDLPTSLHPVFDPDLCIGSQACVSACPEGDVIGIVGGVGTLLVGANCIGHGRCAAECPVGAIQLVFGTEKRGIDVPVVSPDFESNVPGIYIAGELGGMGLIRNAARQGVQACRHALATLPSGGSAELDDLIILGSGPAGFAAALTAIEAGRRFRVIEQDTFGGTVAHYPRQKITLTETIELPLVGRVHKRTMYKEELMELWASIRQHHPFPIQECETVEEIHGGNGAFEVVTSRGRYRSRKVVLAIGRRGTPRKLGVPGEDLPTVTYRLIDPDQYVGRSVLVVGGGDSALEAACTLAETGARAMLGHRAAGFPRAKSTNRDRVRKAVTAGKLRLLLETFPQSIEPGVVWLKDAQENRQRLECDFVIACIGGDLPTALLTRIGIETVRHYGSA